MYSKLDLIFYLVIEIYCFFAMYLNLQIHLQNYGRVSDANRKNVKDSNEKDF